MKQLTNIANNPGTRVKDLTRWPTHTDVQTAARIAQNGGGFGRLIAASLPVIDASILMARITMGSSAQPDPEGQDLDISRGFLESKLCKPQVVDALVKANQSVAMLWTIAKHYAIDRAKVAVRKCEAPRAWGGEDSLFDPPALQEMDPEDDGPDDEQNEELELKRQILAGLSLEQSILLKLVFAEFASLTVPEVAFIADKRHQVSTKQVRSEVACRKRWMAQRRSRKDRTTAKRHEHFFSQANVIYRAIGRFQNNPEQLDRLHGRLDKVRERQTQLRQANIGGNIDWVEVALIAGWITPATPAPDRDRIINTQTQKFRRLLAKLRADLARLTSRQS